MVRGAGDFLLKIVCRNTAHEKGGKRGLAAAAYDHVRPWWREIAGKCPKSHAIDPEAGRQAAPGLARGHALHHRREAQRLGHAKCLVFQADMALGDHPADRLVHARAQSS
jgi:hypothetical protein